jgi:phosphoserine phosphatase RsbU/P
MSHSQARLTDALVRKQVGWVVWGVRMAVAFYALAYIVPHLSPLIVHEKARQWLTMLSLFTGLAAIAWAILRYQFLSARFVIRPGLVFSLAAGLTAGLYIWIFSAARKYLVLLYDVNLPIFEMMFLVSALFFFQPVNIAIDRLVDKVMRRRPRDYYETMQSISRDIYTHLETPRLRTIILNALAESLDAEPLHLLMCDQHKNMCTELSLLTPMPDFRCNGELARAMEKASQPVRVDSVRLQITDQAELRNLDRLQAVLLAPLRHRAKLLGMVAIGPKRNGKAFTSQDKALLEVFCSQVAVALENAQLYKLLNTRQQWEEEIAVAREIHQMLLPAEPPQGRVCRITMMALPSKEVGGDFLDFVRRDDRYLGMSIGDISGKGFAGSLLMSNLQACFRSAAYRLSQPHDVIAEVNRQLTRTTAAGKYATLVYAVLDEEQRVLRYCNAGHNYPILRNRNGAVQRLLESDPLVGIDQEIRFHTHEVQLEDGDVVVFYTDGLTEALDVNTVEYGEQRFMQTIASCPHTEAAAILRYVYEDVSQFAAGASQYDDMTMIILQML